MQAKQNFEPLWLMTKDIFSPLDFKKLSTLCSATLYDCALWFREGIPIHDWTGPCGFSSLSFTGLLYNRYMKVTRVSALRAGRPDPQDIFLVLISVRVWVDPRTIVRLKASSKWIISMTPSGIESEAFWIVSQHHSVGWARGPLWMKVSACSDPRTTISRLLRTSCWYAVSALVIVRRC